MGSNKPTKLGTEWHKFRQRLAWLKGRKVRPLQGEKPSRHNQKTTPPLSPLAAKFINFEVFQTLVIQAIDLEIEKIVASDQEFLRLGLEKIKLLQREKELEAEKRAIRKKWHDQFSFYLNLYFVVAALMTVSVGVGVVIGLNLPTAIACHSEHSPCWHLRLRNLKTIR